MDHLASPINLKQLLEAFAGEYCHACGRGGNAVNESTNFVENVAPNLKRNEPLSQIRPMPLSRTTSTVVSSQQPKEDETEHKSADDDDDDDRFVSHSKRKVVIQSGHDLKNNTTKKRSITNNNSTSKSLMSPLISQMLQKQKEAKKRLVPSSRSFSVEELS